MDTVTSIRAGSCTPGISPSDQKRLVGRPLAFASIEFEPVDGSRGSSGITDASGVYTLQYSPPRAGALTDKHKVTIRTVSSEPDSENPNQKEVLPTKYHSATELKATLKRGRQTVDFDLKP